MRIRNYLLGVMALAIAAAIPATASATVTTQTIKGQTTPSKLSASRKTPTPTALRVDTDTSYSSFDAIGINAYASQVNVDFDNDLVFNTKGIPTCTKAQLDQAPTTEQATAACPKAIVGTGHVNVKGIFPFPPDASGIVTAFNGAPQGGFPVIYLHSRVGPPLNTTTVLTGVLKPSPLGGDYGKRLEVDVPPLGGGSVVITHFDTTVQKPVTLKKKIKGKKKKIKSGYVTATCTDKDKILNYSGTFNFTTRTTPQSPITTTGTSACTPKAKKKK